MSCQILTNAHFFISSQQSLTFINSFLQAVSRLNGVCDQNILFISTKILVCFVVMEGHAQFALSLLVLALAFTKNQPVAEYTWTGCSTTEQSSHFITFHDTCCDTFLSLKRSRSVKATEESLHINLSPLSFVKHVLP